jgi:rsbT co-antagonist protein RsbR
MKQELRYIGEKIVKKHLNLAQNVFKLIDAEYTESLTNAGMPRPTLLEYRAELMCYFGQALYEGKDAMTAKVIDWGKKAANFAIQYNVSLSDSLRAVSFYRTVIWNVFTEELEQKQFAAITMLDVSKIIDTLLDIVCGTIGEVYEEHNSRLMTVAYTALEELSVPVVPIIEGIAVIPLVGAIDTNRAQLIMEVSLNEGTRLKLSEIIFDVSGVLFIDTMVAHQIYRVVESLRLIGINTSITGIRPEIAQTIVSLGMDFSKLKTRANMRQALQEIGIGWMERDVAAVRSN